MGDAAEQEMYELEKEPRYLESVLGRFIVSTNSMMLRMERRAKSIDRATAAFQKETADFKTKKKEVKKCSERDRKESKDEMQEFEKEAERDHKEMNRKWRELSYKMGTIVQDIVAPNIPRILKKYFDAPDLEYFAMCVRKPKTDGPGYREFDVVAVSKDYFLLNETKAIVRPEYASAFREILTRIHEYFPEYSEKKILPVFSSFSISPDVVNYLSQNNIYALAMTDDTMEILNFDEIFR